MTIQIRVNGLKKVNSFFVKLPKQLDEQITAASDQFVAFVQKSAKLRAPRYTGKLANSIKVYKSKTGPLAGKMVIRVESPYGLFQEEGFKPHFVGARRSTRAGGKVGDYMKVIGYGGPGIEVRKFTPFIKPALERGLNQLPTMLANATQRALRRSR